MEPTEKIRSDEDTTSAYDKGWRNGYDDMLNQNPFEAGTQEYDEYEKGYEQGRMDC